jgi:AraC family transcriptional regulator
MTPVQKALWFVESHFFEDVALDDIARAAAVSRFHLTRAFGAATGRSLMRYARARRLTEAARLLVDGKKDVLALALDSGYASHEAFTRAFLDQFGVTPAELRRWGSANGVELVEPIKMDETLVADLELPRFENPKTLLIAGLAQRYSYETSAGIPAQWQRFAPHLGRVPGQIGRAAYGVLYNSDDAGNMDYLCGVEVANFSALPAQWARLDIPPQQYAVFAHRHHVSGIRRTWFTIWNEWLPGSGYEATSGPEFERYGEEFNASRGFGAIEIWLPVARSGER